jgi:hypothetical protein
LIAAEGVAAVAQEHAEQLVFAVGQQGFVARWIDQATAVGVQRIALDGVIEGVPRSVCFDQTEQRTVSSHASPRISVIGQR